MENCHKVIKWPERDEYATIAVTLTRVESGNLFFFLVLNKIDSVSHWNLWLHNNFSLYAGNFLTSLGQLMVAILELPWKRMKKLPITILRNSTASTFKLCACMTSDSVIFWLGKTYLLHAIKTKTYLLINIEIFIDFQQQK